MDELLQTSRAFDRLRDLTIAAIRDGRIATEDVRYIRSAMDRMADAVALPPAADASPHVLFRSVGQQHWARHTILKR